MHYIRRVKPDSQSHGVHLFSRYEKSQEQIRKATAFSRAVNEKVTHGHLHGLNEHDGKEYLEKVGIYLFPREPEVRGRELRRFVAPDS